MQVKAERRLSTGLTLPTAYTMVEGDQQPGGHRRSGGRRFFHRWHSEHLRPGAQERSLSGFDMTSRFVQTVIYDVPFFKNTKGLARSTGRITGLDDHDFAERFPAAINNNDRHYGRAGLRAPTWSQDRKPIWIKANARGSDGSIPPRSHKAPFGRFGNSPRTGAIRLQGVINSDFSVNKRFRFGESRSFEFRTEIFNLFNHFNPDPQTVDLNRSRRLLAASAAACRA